MNLPIIRDKVIVGRVAKIIVEKHWRKLKCVTIRKRLSGRRR